MSENVILGRILKDFLPNPDAKDPSGWSHDRLTPGLFELSGISPKAITPVSLPPPFLVYIMFKRYMGYPAVEYQEKLRWAIPFLYKGKPFVFADRKLGFTITGENTPENLTLVSVMARDLIRAVPVVERLIAPVAKQQIAAGNVTIENKYYRHDGMYGFFRKNALKTFKRQKPNPKKQKHNALFSGTWDPFRYQRQAEYFAAAAVDAYFSRLEHLLALMLPFFACGPIDLLNFLGSYWNDKFKLLFPLQKDPSASMVYQNLLRIKETYRNVLSHGGIARDGSTLYFHYPKVGALPAYVLRKDRHVVQIGIFGIAQDRFEDICEKFDDADKFIMSARRGMPFMAIKGGLDVSCSRDSIREYQLAMSSKKMFEHFMDYRTYISDTHANMDYPG